jgi:hypothetical protein
MAWRALSLALLLSIGVFSGCLGPAPAGTCASADSSRAAACPPALVNETSIPGLPNATFVESTNETPIPATLAAPPQWRVGEWWTIKVADAFDGKTFDATQVVAGTEPSSFLVGMPATAFSTQIMVLHMPGFGQVSRADLSYDVHNCPFEPLKFPLTDGKTWSTKFECNPVSAVVHVTSPTVAVVNLTGPGGRFLVTYDSTVQAITSIVDQNYGTVQVTGHGFGYRGVVTVPHQFRLVFQQARLLVPVFNGTPTPAQPSDTRTIPQTFDQVSFVIILGNILPIVRPGAPDQAAGYYQETVTAPNGTTFQGTMLPSERGLKLLFFTSPEPGGTWKFTHVVAGPGIAEAEGIAYHVYNVDLPSGTVSMPLMNGKAMTDGNSTAQNPDPTYDISTPPTGSGIPAVPFP